MAMFEEFKNIKKQEWAVILLMFLLSKTLVIGAALAGYYLVDPQLSQRWQVVENPFLNLFAQYDSVSYLDITKNNYNPEFRGIGNYNHYPLYPLLVKIFS